MGRLGAVTVGVLVLLTTAPALALSAPVALRIEGPAFALSGAPVAFSGNYHLAIPSGPSVPATIVELFVDDAPSGTTSAPTGSWAIQAAISGRGAHAAFAVAEEGRPTRAQSPTITIVVAEPPSPARWVAAEPLSGSPSARVTWEAPEDDGGAPITQYRVARSENGGAPTLRGTLASSARSFTDGNLIIGRSYVYHVTAWNAVAPASNATVALEGSPPLAPVVVAAPLHLSHQARIQVSGGGGPTQQLDLERSVNGGASWTLLKRLTGDNLSWTDTLWEGAAPLYRGTARSVVGNSAPTLATPTGPLPGVPASASASVPSLVRVEWAEPPSGGPVQGYRVFEDGVARAEVDYDELSAEFSSSPGTHAYTVVATSMAGAGSPSDPAGLTIALAGAPASLVALAIEEEYRGRANLSWEAPLDSGGAPVLWYEIYRTPSGGSRAHVATLEADVMAFSDGNLADNRSYVYEVRAVTAAGGGAFASAAISISDFDWELTAALTSFRACEGTGSSAVCTEVAEGGTYDRNGTGSVRYTANFTGTLTRKDVPQAGRAIYLTAWQVDWDEFAESSAASTNAAGAYVVTWPGLAMTPGTSCRTIEVYGYVTHAGFWRSDTGSFVICP